MGHINKPRAVRDALGLTPTECGRLLLGVNNHKSAYDQWAIMERQNATEEKLSNSMRQYLNLLLMLSMCRDQRTPGCAQALDKWVDFNRERHSPQSI